MGSPRASTKDSPGRRGAVTSGTRTAAPLVEPTARQAIEAFLTAEPGGDSLTMLMLGRHLGPSRRVRDLDDAAEQQRLSEWFDQTWSPRDPQRRDTAREALGDVLTYWRGRGWVGSLTHLKLS